MDVTSSRALPGHRPGPRPSGDRPPRLPADRVPRHVAIIMDGNGRWATDRGLPRTDGHEAGARSGWEVVHGAIEAGVTHLSLYAFSTENWGRPQVEVRHIFSALARRVLAAARQRELEEMGVRVRWAGRRSRVPGYVADALGRLEDRTRNNTVLTLTVCVDYGGRSEITEAAAALAKDVYHGRVAAESIDEQCFARYLSVPELPDVDLLIRTAGELRVSNFFPWQATYAELVFLDTLWPDIDRRDLWRAVEIYAARTRTHGRLPGASA
ncbi:polyprenyl diphosphate synthase [Streptomyces sp. NBC_01803]|uniref:polyprenyl diphosphate synthase n=1 Tax=Streptomyces sp. NBC_01803 TaxID=2975946 RepID=UPI002DD9834B|nr:polyprenyl diphosphate synthase [Streptomyces sp. NBC_01803]WSA46116.1 polyprenyl diphosphate synthase [Streptomyces sp. NBC_01803]